MKYVEGVAKEIAKHINSYKVIVTKSTVPVGTGEKVRKIVSKHLKEKTDFDVVSNPEFLREGAGIEDFMRPNRIIIGASSGQAIAIMKDLYRPLYLIETPFVITDVKTAELIKYASNAFLATKISFINELSNLCEVVGANVQTVAKGMGLDRRIGPKFLHAGPGYGGSCFPKDTLALLQIGKENNVNLGIISAAVDANKFQKEKAADTIVRTLGKLKGKTVCMLGLSFKPNTNDLRDAPALFIIDKLLKKGAIIRAYDPVAMQDARKTYPRITYCKDAYEAIKGAEAVVIATEWNQFRNLDLSKIKKTAKGKFFFDLRNIYEPERLIKMGFSYYSVGR
jgi:UDPglucose 6-dehydrogenase